MIKQYFLSRKIAKRNFLVFTCFVIAFVMPFQALVKNAYAQCNTVAECEAQINQIENDIKVYQQEANVIAGQINTLQGVLSKLARDKAIIQSQIDINQVKYDKLVIQIAETEKEIKNNQDSLGDTIADMYVGDDITPIEMIAGSGSISEYLDRQEYRTSVRNQLSAMITKVKELKKTLDAQKLDVEHVLSEQTAAKQELSNKEAEQQSILAQTQGQEAAYQAMINDGNNRKDDLAQKQQQLIAEAQAGAGSVTGISDPSKGNYPWGGYGCYVDNNLDSWGGLSGDGYDPLMYACRQCTSYAAWKILEYTGQEYRYLGNANNWWRRFPSSQVHDTARRNSVGVMDGGTYGHVVWVETDPDASGYIIISQYNDWAHNTGDNSGPGWGNYSKIRVHQSAYDHFIYF